MSLYTQITLIFTLILNETHWNDMRACKLEYISMMIKFFLVNYSFKVLKKGNRFSFSVFKVRFYGGKCPPSVGSYASLVTTQ